MVESENINVSCTEFGNASFTTWITLDNNRAEGSSNRGNVIALEALVFVATSITVTGVNVFIQTTAAYAPWEASQSPQSSYTDDVLKFMNRGTCIDSS